MSVISDTHTRTSVNGSVLIYFVIRVAAQCHTATDSAHCPSPDGMELPATEDGVEALLSEIARRVPTILSSYAHIDNSKVAVIAVPESPLRDQHFFELAAQIYTITKSRRFNFAISLSPMGPTFKTFSGSIVGDARSAMTNLFGNHRSFVKIIQNLKKKNEELSVEAPIDHLAYLMAHLVRLEESSVLEKEEEILELMQKHNSLRDVALHFSARLSK